MPTFDVVSEVDVQEVRNAVDQASRELSTRFDFKGIDCGFELAGEQIKMHAEEEFQLEQMEQILKDKLIRRNLDVRSLDAGKVEASGKQKRQQFDIKQGVDADTARKIVKLIKESKLKVQSQVQGDQVRVTGKKRDDLQAVMALLKNAEIEIPLNFKNLRD
ncbi:MAG: YajQ family cyclic di-GMP-binding protein [Pseudomonadales bacterium]